MAAILSVLLFFSPFIFTLAFFIVSLILYICAKKKQTQDAAAVSPARVKLLRILLIVSSIILGVQVVVGGALITMLFFAVAYM